MILQLMNGEGPAWKVLLIMVGMRDLHNDPAE
jgi:hypothetical protein